MVVISVDVPEFIAKRFSDYKIVKSEQLYEEIDNNKVFVDFWNNWIWKKEFEEYLALKSSL